MIASLRETSIATSWISRSNFLIQRAVIKLFLTVSVEGKKKKKSLIFLRSVKGTNTNLLQSPFFTVGDYLTWKTYVCTSKRMAWAVINGPYNLPCGIVQNKCSCPVMWKSFIYYVLWQATEKWIETVEDDQVGHSVPSFKPANDFIRLSHCAGLNFNVKLTTAYQ